MTGRGPSGRQPQAVRSALAILRTVAQSGPGVTAKQVSIELGMPQATTYRLFNLLVGEEYLVRLPDLRGFALGARCGELVGLPVPAAPAAPLEPVLAGLRASTGCEVTLATYDGLRLEVLVPSQLLPGSHHRALAAHLHASALGKVFLAASPTTGAVGLLQALTPHTITDARQLECQLAQVRAQRLAVQFDELRPGSGCVAVPVTSQRGDLLAGVAVSAPSVWLGPRVDWLRDLLRPAAADIAALLPQ